MQSGSLEYNPENLLFDAFSARNYPVGSDAPRFTQTTLALAAVVREALSAGGMML